MSDWTWRCYNLLRSTHLGCGRDPSFSHLKPEPAMACILPPTFHLNVEIAILYLIPLYLLTPTHLLNFHSFLVRKVKEYDATQVSEWIILDCTAKPNSGDTLQEALKGCLQGSSVTLRGSQACKLRCYFISYRAFPLVYDPPDCWDSHPAFLPQAHSTGPGTQRHSGKHLMSEWMNENYLQGNVYIFIFLPNIFPKM